MSIGRYILLLKPQSSLLLLSRQKIKQNHIDLYKKRNNNLIFKILNKFTNRGSIKPIVFVVLFLAALCFCSFNLFDFIGLSDFHLKKIKADLVIQLIDSRINNVITITSISLAVASVLLANIAQRSKETYDLLFKQTFLYPIVYYILTVIGLLLLISFFRAYLNDCVIVNLGMLMMTFIMLIIFCIGYLFSKIIQFTNPNYLHTVFSNILISDANQILYYEKLNKISAEILQNKLSKYGAIVKSSINSMHPQQIFIETNKSKIIVDVDIKKIEGCIKTLHFNESKKEIDFNIFGLNDSIHPEFKRVFACLSKKITQAGSLSIAVNNYIYTSKPQDKMIDFGSTRQSLFDKMKNSVDNNNIETLSQTLDNYNQLFDMYFKSQRR